MEYNHLNLKFNMQDSLVEIHKISNERITNPYPMHNHGKDCFEIHFAASGYGILYTENFTYNIEPETFYITGPYIGHAQFPNDEELREYGIYFSISHNSKKQKKQLIEMILSQPFFIAYNQSIFGNMFHKIFEELDKQQLGYLENVESYIRCMLVQLLRLISDENNINKDISSDNIIQQHLLIDNIFISEYKDVTLENLASKLGLSVRQTERLIKKEYGKTFIQKKLESRMSAAKVLLSDKSYSITEIAERLGYSSVEHFSVAFKKYYNITAREYRKNDCKSE